MTLTISEYRDACDFMEGYCRACGYMTTSCVEPDTEPEDRRECMECLRRGTVVGIEYGMIAGMIEITDDPVDELTVAIAGIVSMYQGGEHA